MTRAALAVSAGVLALAACDGGAPIAPTPCGPHGTAIVVHECVVGLAVAPGVASDSADVVARLGPFDVYELTGGGGALGRHIGHPLVGDAWAILDADRRLVGFTLFNAPLVRTRDGIGPGSTRDEVHDSLGAPEWPGVREDGAPFLDAYRSDSTQTVFAYTPGDDGVPRVSGVGLSRTAG